MEIFASFLIFEVKYSLSLVSVPVAEGFLQNKDNQLYS